MEIPLRELRESGKEVKEESYELEDGKHRPTMVGHGLSYNVVLVLALVLDLFLVFDAGDGSS